MKTADAPTRSTVIVACKCAVQRLPRKLRLPALGGLVLVFGFVVYTLTAKPSATLNLVCRHNFRSAELSVLVDGRLTNTETLSGTAKKRFGLFDTRIEGSFSKSMSVPAGEHVLQVRVRSAADTFDQTRQCTIKLAAGKDATVVVNAQRGGMSLVYQGLPAPAADDTGSGYFNYARTAVATVLGSAVSAAIGFVVQDFLRTRKSSFPAQSQNS